MQHSRVDVVEDTGGQWAVQAEQQGQHWCVDSLPSKEAAMEAAALLERKLQADAGNRIAGTAAAAHTDVAGSTNAEQLGEEDLRHCSMEDFVSLLRQQIADIAEAKAAGLEAQNTASCVKGSGSGTGGASTVELCVPSQAALHLTSDVEEQRAAQNQRPASAGLKQGPAPNGDGTAAHRAPLVDHTAAQPLRACFAKAIMRSIAAVSPSAAHPDVSGSGTDAGSDESGSEEEEDEWAPNKSGPATAVKGRPLLRLMNLSVMK
jgi:hypothetical protein